MQTSDVTADRLRKLAETGHSSGRVLSLYLNLEPTEFAAAPARATAITSLLDDASRRARAEHDLSHADQVALREDVARAEAFFANDFSAEGAHGLALFACGPRGLFDVMRLARPVENRVVIDGAPWIAPLTRQFAPDGWAVALVNRAMGRVLRGSIDHLDEQPPLKDWVHGQHDQGGWSQARYQRSNDQDAAEHIARVLGELKRQNLERPFDHLLIATPDETWGFVESHLDPALRQKLCGRIDVQVEDSNADEVFAAARKVMLEVARRRERELLDRMEERLARHGRAAGDLDAVLDALVQRRVEALLLDENARAPGVRCGTCGWMATRGERCPVDGQPVEHRPDIVEDAIECALLQSAEVVYIRQHDDLRAHGGVGAVLRF